MSDTTFVTISTETGGPTVALTVVSSAGQSPATIGTAVLPASTGAVSSSSISVSGNTSTSSSRTNDPTKTKTTGTATSGSVLTADSSIGASDSSAIITTSIGTWSSVSTQSVLPTVTPQNGYISLTTTINAPTAGPTAVEITAAVKQKSNGGIIAGAAIAALVAGLVIGAIVMLFLRKKNNKKSRSSRRSEYAGEVNSHGPVQTVRERPVEKAVATVTTTDPDYLLPQEKDDQSMGAAANGLFVHIGNHVENFYHNNSLRENIAPQSEEEELLVGRKTRHSAIKRLITREMLAAIAWDCKPENSLLSADTVSMAQHMPRGKIDNSTYEVAWSRWRVSTALLLATEDGSQKAQARKFWVDRLQHKLQPFQIDDPETLAMIKEDLHAICKLAENLASLICSQPGNWEFLWPRSNARGQLIISPEFVRTTDGKGRRLDRPRRAVEAQRTQ